MEPASTTGVAGVQSLGFPGIQAGLLNCEEREQDEARRQFRRTGREEADREFHRMSGLLGSTGLLPPPFDVLWLPFLQSAL